MAIVSTLAHRIVASWTTFPSPAEWIVVGKITATSTALSAVVAWKTHFVSPADFSLPSSPIKPLSALIFPSLVEETFWRGTLIPVSTLHPIAVPSSVTMMWPSIVVLVLHVVSHPIAAAWVWPRGKDVFGDPRFLLLATIVLAGATASFWATGGSVWAATVAHGVPVALWRDFWGGEARLSHLVDSGNDTKDS